MSDSAMLSPWAGVSDHDLQRLIDRGQAQGGELKLATSPGTAGSIKATVTPFFVIVTRTAAGPNSTLYPPKDQAIADAPVVLNACGKTSAPAAKK